MLEGKKALLLIGSPKIKNSTSESLGNYFIDNLGRKGFSCEKLNVVSALRKDEQKLIDEAVNADILVISTPLYVDSYPSQLIRALEIINNYKKANKSEKKQCLAVILNCGFPESFQNNTAIEILKSFADKAGFQWLGGLAMGCGPSINGMPVEKMGGMTRNIVKAIDLAAEAVSKGECISSEAVKLMAKGIIPASFYLLVANLGWKPQAKKHNAHRKLYARPYMKE